MSQPTDILQSPARASESGPAPVCRKLRTKQAFLALVGADGEQRLWHKGDGSTAVYWCLQTMECAGIDGGLVHATECGPQRACYVAPPR